jgi:hypothetical protein
MIIHKRVETSGKTHSFLFVLNTACPAPRGLARLHLGVFSSKDYKTGGFVPDRFTTLPWLSRRSSDAIAGKAFTQLAPRGRIPNMHLP